MSLLSVVLISAAVLTLAYFTYGRLLARLLRLDPHTPTPAVALRDDVDYVPLQPGSLLNQHFSAIAAAGPIVGPILAGVMFGWAPALIWILVGAIFIGGVHDLTALLASVRHKARSIAEVVGEYMSPLSYILFLIFIWLALVYVVVAFTDITAGAFVKLSKLEDGTEIRGGGIATSSIMYLVLPLAMGLLIRFAKMPVWLALVIFLPLVAASIILGQSFPLELGSRLELNAAQTQRLWNVILLGYCFVASLIPMWLLLQPRGLLGGCFLFAALAGGGLGLIFSGRTIEFPAFRGWESAAGQPLFPVLFITIACGACSGFHAMVASGTTSKQLRTEGDAKLIGYGAMLMEAMVAIISLCCVMTLTANSPLLTGERGPSPDLLYANGIGAFLSVLGVPIGFACAFALMAFTTFVYDTLDVCTRLGRYILQELLGWQTRLGAIVATALTVGVPLFFLTREFTDAAGKPVPVWREFWGLFGASNQLLAALTLLGVTLWLTRTRRATWVWFVTGLPAAFMYVISMWELVRIARRGITAQIWSNPVPWVAVVLMGLAALMGCEALRILLARPGGRSARGVPVEA